MGHRYRLWVLAILSLVCQGIGAEPIDVKAIQKAYAANNRNADVPLVWWMMRGFPQFVLYEDGQLLVPTPGAKSRIGTAHLDKDVLDDALKKIEAQYGFWNLSPKYKLSEWSEQPKNTISLRIPGKKPTIVSVYGRLTPTPVNKQSPPEAFVRMTELLNSLIPKETDPWDPGYVEIGWADYDYAPDPSLPWPAEWPGLEGPLSVPLSKKWVTQWIVLFPSSRVDELDAFLARCHLRGAILVDGKKLAGSYHWPLRSEQSWNPKYQ